MDIPQLKLLAGLLRGLLEQRNVPLGNSQALDAIAALPGLRNWPEVMAFPDRVQACELDSASTGRLAFRLRKKHEVELTPEALLRELSPPAATGARVAAVPQVWPAGPKPGVYVTTEQAAINALLLAYEDATDGGVVYAERAGTGYEGAIELGEWGLTSSGLSRVPSGTLFVLGPIELNQESWGDSSDRLQWACIHAMNSGHRVAVLIDTPEPMSMFQDIDMMVRGDDQSGQESADSLAGIVTEDGDLQARVPFVQPMTSAWSSVRVSTPTQDLAAGAAPATESDTFRAVMTVVERALAGNSTGILAFGTTYREEHHGIAYIAATLPLTAHLGPAARIKPRGRSTPAKDMMVPDAVKALPYLASIESAYAHGFRRMIVDCGYTDAVTMLKYDDVLFMTGTYGLSVDDVFMSVCRGPSGFDHIEQVVERAVAVVGCARVDGKRGSQEFVDAYAKPGFSLGHIDQVAGTDPDEGRFEAVKRHLRDNRVLRWEDELRELLDSKAVSLTTVKEQLGRRHDLKAFLKTRQVRRAVA